MKKPRLVAATSASLLGLALVATTASAQEQPVEVTLSSNEVGNAVGITATGSGCLPEDGDRVTVRAAKEDGDSFINGVFGLPNEDGTWEATGDLDFTVEGAGAGSYVVRAFCHFGQSPEPGDLPIGASTPFDMVDPDPDDPDPDDPDPDDPPDDPPTGPGDDDDPPTPEDPGTDPDVDAPEGGDDGEDGDDGDDGSPAATPASTSPQPASAAPAVNGEPDLTG